MLSFEGSQTMGAAPITEKLVVRRPRARFQLRLGTDPAPSAFRGPSTTQGLPFTTVQHRVATLDAQPAAADKASIMVLVTGQLIVRLPSEPPAFEEWGGAEVRRLTLKLTGCLCVRLEMRPTRCRSARRSTSSPKAPGTMCTFRRSPRAHRLCD